MKDKKFYLLIFGCQMNISDAERLATALKALGYQETNNEDEADLIGVVACSVKQTAVDRIYGKVRNWQIVKEKRPLITMLSGCVLDYDRKKLADKFDIFLDIKNLDNLAESIKKAAPEEKLALPSFFDIQPSYYSSYRAYVPIMTGCNKFCTYCAVPYTRGREVSRPSASIIAEIKELLAKNYKEIILLGQNVNSYGLDKISARGGPHPYDMSDELITVMKNGKNINNYLHLPVQSGSDEQLKKMNRHYSIAHYTELINKIRTTLPDISISTDLIVGFAGETVSDFKATEKLVKSLKFNLSFTSQYSQRTGTVAAKLYPDDVTQETKKERFNIINTQIGKNAKIYNEQLVGKTFEVLIDAVNCEEKKCKNIGKLANYTAVHVITKEPLKVGEFYQVKITQADAWGVLAEIYVN